MIDRNVPHKPRRASPRKPQKQAAPQKTASTKEMNELKVTMIDAGRCDYIKMLLRGLFRLR